MYRELLEGFEEIGVGMCLAIKGSSRILRAAPDFPIGTCLWRQNMRGGTFTKKILKNLNK